jgi:hypothetical protein
LRLEGFINASQWVFACDAPAVCPNSGRMSGNFLYVAFRELSRLDLRIMTRLKESLSTKEFHKRAPSLTIITPKHFFGLDIDPFGVELGNADAREKTCIRRGRRNS